MKGKNGLKRKYKKYSSKRQVENQDILALIVYLLTLLIKLELDLKQTVFHVLRHLRALQHEPFGLFNEIFEPD